MRRRLPGEHNASILMKSAGRDPVRRNPDLWRIAAQIGRPQASLLAHEANAVIS